MINQGYLDARLFLRENQLRKTKKQLFETHVEKSLLFIRKFVERHTEAHGVTPTSKILHCRIVEAQYPAMKFFRSGGDTRSLRVPSYSKGFSAMIS